MTIIDKKFEIGDIVSVIDVYDIYSGDCEFIIIDKLYTQTQKLYGSKIDMQYDEAIYEMLSIKRLASGEYYKATAVGKYLIKMA